MKDYLINFMNMFDYPQEAKAVLIEAYKKIYKDKQNKEAFEALLEAYTKDINCNYNVLLDKMGVVSRVADIHPYTGNLLLPICMSKALKTIYDENGMDEQIWFTSMCDLKYKLIECHEVYGIWGTFAASWFGGFFNMNRFGFGKLQFEAITFNDHYESDDVVLKSGDRVLNVHIPRTGVKLDRESKRESYRQAAAFYQESFGEKPIVFVCHSWLLSPRHKEVLSLASNLYAFIDDYDIIEQGEYDDYSQVWRLFDVEYKGNVDELPQDTSLRRVYVDWIRKGEKVSWGYGVYVWKG